MACGVIKRISHKIVGFAVVLAVIFNLSSCTQTSPMPEDARDALQAYWQSLPNPGVENRIKRTWPGTISGEASSSLSSAMEIWCVEAEILSERDPSINGELLVWIVMRENKDSPWSAVMLAAMSSTWPYEACGMPLGG